MELARGARTRTGTAMYEYECMVASGFESTHMEPCSTMCTSKQARKISPGLADSCGPLLLPRQQGDTPLWEALLGPVRPWQAPMNDWSRRDCLPCPGPATSTGPNRSLLAATSVGAKPRPSWTRPGRRFSLQVWAAGAKAPEARRAACRQPEVEWRAHRPPRLLGPSLQARGGGGFLDG